MTQRKVALITGGARGIGAAIATRLAQDGCAVVVSDVDHKAAGETAAALAATGFAAEPLGMDVGNAESIAAGFAVIASAMAVAMSWSTTRDRQDFCVRRYPARALEPGDGGERHRPDALRPASGAPDASAQVGTHHQPRLGERRARQRRPHRVRHLQGGAHGIDTANGDRARAIRHHRERRGARSHRHAAHARAALGEHAPRLHPRGAGGALRNVGRSGRRGELPRFRRRCLHHRPCHAVDGGFLAAGVLEI